MGDRLPRKLAEDTLPLHPALAEDRLPLHPLSINRSLSPSECPPLGVPRNRLRLYRKFFRTYFSQRSSLGWPVSLWPGGWLGGCGPQGEERPPPSRTEYGSTCENISPNLRGVYPGGRILVKPIYPGMFFLCKSHALRLESVFIRHGPVFAGM